MQNTSYRPLVERYPGFKKPNVKSSYCSVKRFLLTTCALVIGLFCFAQVLLAFRHLYSDIHLSTDSDGELVSVSYPISRRYKALCLDGSTPAYYFRKGYDAGERKWLIVFPHSQWCYSAQDCYEYSKQKYGGSMSNRPLTTQFSGILSPDSYENEYLYNWNMVLLIPCDGAGLLGNTTITVRGEHNSTLYSYGANIIQAVTEHINMNHKIEDAHQILLYGQDSGAISAALYTRFIKSLYPDGPEIRVLLHNGLLTELRNPSHEYSWLQLHELKKNSLILCVNTSYLTADSIIWELVKSGSKATLFTGQSPAWPVSVSNQCEISKCEELGLNQKYQVELHTILSEEPNSRKLSIIYTACDSEISTKLTVLNSHDEVYRKLTQSLMVSWNSEFINYMSAESRNCTAG